MIYEIVSAPKSDLPTEEAVRAALAKEKPGLTVENITTEGNEWVVRLADGKPPWLDKEDSGDAPDESADSADADSDSDSDSDSKDKGDKKDKKKGDPVGEVKNVIDQLTTLFQDLGGKVQDLQAAHDEKEQKLKDIGDTVGDSAGGPGDLPPGLEGDGEAVGPTPGGPPAPPMPAKGLDKRKPGLPGAPGGGLPTFTHKYEVATHPGVDSEGKRISLTAAATALEADPDFVEYEVVGMTENADGTYSAKLKLRSE